MNIISTNIDHFCGQDWVLIFIGYLSTGDAYYPGVTACYGQCMCLFVCTYVRV